MKDKSKLGNTIQTYRVQKGWTQKELAECSGLAINTVARIERGLFLPKIETLLILCRCLNLKIKIGDVEI